MKDVYIPIKSEEEYVEIVRGSYLCEYMFAFPGNIIPKWNEVKKAYHGNSKLLAHLFYNTITGEYEMQVTTRSVEKTYPQIKHLNIIEWDDMSWEVLNSIFGDRQTRYKLV